MSKIAAIIGRILIAFIFIVSGATKLTTIASTEQMIQSVGLPAGFAIPVGLIELVLGIMLAIGLAVRLVSLVLFVFTAATILFFHNQFTDPMQAAMAMKNLAIMGGLLLAFAHSQMWSHYYAINRERTGELAARDAERRAHDAELRAARAEAIVEGREEAAAAVDNHNVAVDTHHDGYRETVVVPQRRRWFDW
jgi:putative oxidoreductase